MFASLHASASRAGSFLHGELLLWPSETMVGALALLLLAGLACLLFLGFLGIHALANLVHWWDISRSSTYHPSPSMHAHTSPPRRREPVIEVFSSPRPTLTLRPAVRAGAKRVRAPRVWRRAKRVVYNPGSSSGHCGYQAIIAASMKRPTKRRIQRLRLAVAAELSYLHQVDGSCMGIKIRDLIDMEGLDIETYCVGVATRMWASKVELAIAAKFMNTQVALQEPGQVPVSLHGERPTKIITIVKEHYILHDYKGKANLAFVSKDIMRAGVRTRERSRSRSISTTQPFTASTAVGTLQQHAPPTALQQQQVLPDPTQQTQQEVVDPLDQGWETWGQPRFQGAIRWDPEENYFQDERNDTWWDDSREPSQDLRSVPSDDDEVQISYATPRSIPSAQFARTSRVVFEDITYYRGYLRAHPRADPQHVMREICNRHQMQTEPTFYPRLSEEWEQVEEVWLDYPLPLRGEGPIYDGREGVWERQHPVRTLEVYDGTRYLGQLAVSNQIDVDLAFERVQSYFPIIEPYQIRVREDGTWSVHVVEGPTTLPRAGMRTSRPMVNQNKEAKMLVKVRIPAIPERHVPFKLPLRYTREDVKKYASFYYNVPEEHIDVLEALPLSDLPGFDSSSDEELGRPKNEHDGLREELPRDMHIRTTVRWATEDGLSDPSELSFPSHRRVADLISQMAEAKGINPMMVIATIEDLIMPNFFYISAVHGKQVTLYNKQDTEIMSPWHTPEYYRASGVLSSHDVLQHEPSPPLGRAGARHGDVRRLTAQRAMMQNWAAQRMSSDIPELSEKTCKALAKAEGRVVSAVLQAKSSAQVKHIVEAALKRTGMTKLLKEDQQDDMEIEKNDEIEELKTKLEELTSKVHQLQEQQSAYMTNFEQTINNWSSLQLQFIPPQQQLWQQQTTSFVDVIGKLSQCIASIEKRVENWETTYLAYISESLEDLRRARHLNSPTTPQDTLPPTQEREEDVPEQPLLARMEEQSLRRCCERAVSSSGVPPRPALAPFARR